MKWEVTIESQEDLTGVLADLITQRFGRNTVKVLPENDVPVQRAGALRLIQHLKQLGVVLDDKKLTAFLKTM